MIVTTKTVDATVQPVDSSDPGEFDVILSTDMLDRDGERLFADEWKMPLPSKIVFDTDHSMTLDSVVGSGAPRIEDGQMRVHGTYASTPHAQLVRKLVHEGHVTSTSVAFTQSKTQKDAKPERELLNGSFVVIPANPEAIVLSSKSRKALGIKDGETPPTADVIQAIHDAAYLLGAMCTAEGWDDETDEPDDGGDWSAGKSHTHVQPETAGLPQAPDGDPADAADAAATTLKGVPAADPPPTADPSAAIAAVSRGLQFLIQQSIERASNA